ncbi:hypothetical protein MMC31_001929 [Peltigera leucophlebia]|nr:hypothetical protein [Peltigera leucophlebia]
MDQPQPEDISSPLRILVLSPESTPLPSLLSDSNLLIRNPYYSATIPIWHDQLPLSLPELERWEEEWLKEEAGEVIRAVGAWVLVFRKAVNEGGDEGEVTLSHIRLLLSTISRLLERNTTPYSLAPEPVLLAVGVHQPVSPRAEVSTEEWEDLCRECGGWEWVDEEVSRDEGNGGRNEFGEKTGLPRLLEALEANEWAATATAHDDIDFEGSSGGSDLLFGAELDWNEDELGAALLDEPPQKCEEGEEMGGGKGEDDRQVLELERMMIRMQAVKAMGQDMPQVARKKFAAKATDPTLACLLWVAGMSKVQLQHSHDLHKNFTEQIWRGEKKYHDQNTYKRSSPTNPSPCTSCHQMQHEELLQKPFFPIKKKAQNENGIYNI